MSAFKSTQAELKKMGVKVEESALAATAIILAHALDDHSSGTSKAYLAKSLADVMRDVRDLAPKQEERDDLTELRAKRDARLAGLSAAPYSALP